VAKKQKKARLHALRVAVEASNHDDSPIQFKIGVLKFVSAVKAAKGTIYIYMDAGARRQTFPNGSTRHETEDNLPVIIFVKG
jgi:hypothetical protein